MARIRLILEDDNGQTLSSGPELTYELDGSCDNLDQIEWAVEKAKRRMLPDIEKRLLERAQDRQVAFKKNSGLPSERQIAGDDQDDSR